MSNPAASFEPYRRLLRFTYRMLDLGERFVAGRAQDETDETSDGAIDFEDYGPQLSRSFRALKLWMTFKAYGARKLRAAIESNIAVMRYLADRIDASSDFVRLAPVPSSVVCFQYRSSDDPSRRSGPPGQVERAGGRAGARRARVNKSVIGA